MASGVYGLNIAERASRGYDLGARIARDKELMQYERDPGIDPNSGYTYPEPTAVGPMPEEAGPQVPVGLETVANQRELMPQQTAPQPATPQQRTAGRAAIYRKYGENQEADRLMRADADLGLVNVQADEARQRVRKGEVDTEAAALGLEVKKRENEEALSAKKIREATTGKLMNLTDEQGKPRQPTPEEMTQNQRELITQLYAAGHTKDAEAVGKAMVDAVKARAEADSVERKAAANQAYVKAVNGDYSGVIELNKRFNYGLGGPSIESIEPGPKPGTVRVVGNDGRGRAVKVVPAQQVLDSLKMMASDDPAALQRLEELAKAQIAQARAAANSSNASAASSTATAERTRATTKAEGTDREEEARIRKLYAIPQAKRTPEQQAEIDGFESMKRAGFRPVGDSMPNQAFADPMGAPASRFNRNSAKWEVYDAKTNTWREAGGGPAGGAAPAPGSRPPLDAFRH